MAHAVRAMAHAFGAVVHALRTVAHAPAPAQAALIGRLLMAEDRPSLMCGEVGMGGMPLRGEETRVASTVLGASSMAGRRRRAPTERGEPIGS